MHRRASHLALVLTLVAPLLVSLSTTPLRADSYTIYHVGNGNSEENIGLTSNGIAVLYGIDNCGTLAGTYCYSTYTEGVLTGTSATLPPLTFDNGSPCSTSLPSGYTATASAICNGSYAAVHATNASTMDSGLFLGQIGMLSKISGVGGLRLSASDPAEDILVDSRGDVLWLDGHSEENFEAFDVTSRIAPEPSTLALLGTGILGMAGAVRRRLVRA